MEESKPDLGTLLKRVVELVKPDLRANYKIIRKAKVVASHPAGGAYYADVQPLRNDESVDPNEPVIPQVEIPIIWAGPNRGIVCPPAVGTLCDLEYYDGDPNYPRIGNFRWQGAGAPEAQLDELVIQHGPGVLLRFGPDGKFYIETPEAAITAATVKITGNVEVTGNLSISGEGSFGAGASVQGDVNATGQVLDGGGNTNHHSHE